MAGRNKRNTPSSILEDGTNQQIIAAKNLKPNASLEEIGKAIGLSPSAVCRRMSNIKTALAGTDEVAISNDQIRALVPLAVAVYAEKLGHGDRDVARDILKTHGVIVDKREIKWDLKDPAAVRSLLQSIPSETLDALDDTDDSSSGD